MASQDSNLRSLLSSTRSGTFFVSFRSRSANPEGFDSKMKLWIGAVEEWAVLNKKLTFSLNDIHKIFVSDSGIRSDKECIRLVFSEMKRQTRLVPLKALKSSTLWASAEVKPYLDHFIDPNSWFSWSVKKFVFDPATWAMSALYTAQNQPYSDLTDMSITDDMKFLCHKSLHELSQNLFIELVRISKAEKQFCFEYQHLLELIMPILNTIIDATDSKELLEMLDIIIEYLAINNHVAIQMDNDSKLVKIANQEDPNSDKVMINKKDIATARLLRAKELLTADADSYHNQAQRAKLNALESYKKNEVAKAKSLLRSHKRMLSYAEQKESQLNNVEMMLDQLENTNSNMMILQAYKDGAEALKIANTHLDNNTSILDDVYDATAEAHHLNEEMNQMLNDISCISQGHHDYTNADIEAELSTYVKTENENIVKSSSEKNRQEIITKEPSGDEETKIDELEARLNELTVCNDSLKEQSIQEQKKPIMETS